MKILIIIVCVFAFKFFVQVNSKSLINSVRIRNDGKPVVHIPQGEAVGITENVNNVTFYAFKSLPFALPPIKERRFMVRL